MFDFSIEFELKVTILIANFQCRELVIDVDFKQCSDRFKN